MIDVVLLLIAVYIPTIPLYICFFRFVKHVEKAIERRLD